MKYLRNVLIGFVALSALFFFFAPGGRTQSSVEIADTYLQKIADGLKVRNEANAPLAQSLSEVFNGEISQSEFIGIYPSQLNQASNAAKEIDEICVNPPEISDNRETEELRAAAAMLELAKGFCDSEFIKWQYITKAIEAAATFDQNTFDQAMVKFDEYSLFMYNTIDTFIKNDSINAVLPKDQIDFFAQMRDIYKV
jgi:hypothetical protein